MIVTNEDVKSIIDEWFADRMINGKVEVAKLYASIMNYCDKNLNLFLNDEGVE